MPARIFVSYSHKDIRWHSELRTKLGSGIYEEKFELWSDDRLAASQDWKGGIDVAMAGSSIALFLVSGNFLRSKFIVRDELRQLLKRRKAGGVKVFWIAIDKIPDNLLEEAGLYWIHALWPEPLSKLEAGALEDAWMTMGAKLIGEIDSEQWDDLKKKVSEALVDANVILENVLAEGDYSVFYKARQGNTDVVVKALVPAPGREWLSRDFLARAALVRKIENSTAIDIRDVIDTGSIPCVVMDFVNAKTLAKRLKEGEKLPARTIADILAQLVRVAGHLHRMDGQPIVGPVRPSHVHYDDEHGRSKALISLVPIANETLTSCRTEPTRLLTTGTLEYLSPERYDGKPLDWRTDQYHLGLLAVELLAGKLPFPIKSFSDLEKMRATYLTSPRKYFSEEFRRTEPALTFVLAKMLERHPEDRWKTTQDLFEALEDVSAGKVPEVIKQYVDAQFADALNNNLEFFSSFYRILFTKSDEIQDIFKRYNVGMDEQYRKLAEAITSILEFNRARFGQQISRHRGMGLTVEHFGLFREAFLEALQSAQGADEYSQDAWGAVLRAALTYMSDQVCGVPGDAARPSSPIVPAR